MKDLIFNPSNINKIEFWAATTIFVLMVISHISQSLNIHWPPSRMHPGGSPSPFNYHFISEIIRYVTIYGAFLILSFKIVPRLIQKEAVVLQLFLAVIIFLLVGVVFGTTATYLKYQLVPSARTERSMHNFLFQNSMLYAFWLLLMFGFYTLIKYTGLYILNRSEDIRTKFPFITPGGLAAFVTWMTVLFFLIAGGADREFIAVWSIGIPSAILLYWFSLQTLIPKSLPKKHPLRSYILKVILVIVVSILPVSLLSLLLSGDDDAAAIMAFFYPFFQLLITAPLSWIIFKRQMQGAQEVFVLKQALGQSNANFDFLRSQINPHFLFNALNTIYGTALQEKAERTSEGIEKLGDMMRFMLQENMQEKISLAREIDYLNNYISLQKLRTDPNPIVSIDAHIEHPVSPVQIAPMLLIPFVENAFKHGISFREPSHIKITLEVRGTTLYFDVYNSKHAKQENDPEKDKSGIGLTNVKQRLQLLYPGKHELIIRETGKEFFVHLTLHLS